MNLCRKDLDESTWTTMSCPDCGSDDVECESDRCSHRHHCNACGLTHEWAAVKR